MSGDTDLVRGGCYASPEAWIGAIIASGYRAELQPDAPRFGGTLYLKLGHASIVGGRDILVELDMRVFHPAADVPKEDVDRRKELLSYLETNNAPSTLTRHHGLVLAWLEGGRDECVSFWEDELDRMKRQSSPHPDDVAEIEGYLAYWQGQRGDEEPKLEQEVFFDRGSGRYGEFASWLLAAGYAATSGGRLVGRGGEILSEGAACLEPATVAKFRREHDSLVAQLERRSGEVIGVQIFEEWAVDDDEDDDCGRSTGGVGCSQERKR